MQSYQPLQERLYAELKGMIDRAELKPDCIYSETQMSHDLNASRTPFKIALARLSQEKYIDIIPSKGFRLHVFTDEDVENLYQQRTAIEGFCTYILIEQLHSDSGRHTLEKLQNITAQMKECIQGRNVGRFLSLDREFHSSLVTFSGNADFQQQYSLVIAHQIISATGHSYLRSDHMNQVYQEHVAIISAIENKSFETCYQAVYHHMEQSKNISIINIHHTEA